MHGDFDLDKDSKVSYAEVMAVIEMESDNQAEVDFFRSHDAILKYDAGDDKEFNIDEWMSFFACKHGQPRAYWAYVWLQEAEAFGGEGHMSMPDENVADFLVNDYGYPIDDIEEMLDSLQGKGARDEVTGELWFWAVYNAPE